MASIDMDMTLSKLWDIVKDREAWRTAVHEVTRSQEIFEQRSDVIEAAL